jgi:hypothetical protein
MTRVYRDVPTLPSNHAQRITEITTSFSYLLRTKLKAGSDTKGFLRALDLLALVRCDEVEMTVDDSHLNAQLDIEERITTRNWVWLNLHDAVLQLREIEDHLANKLEGFI